MATPRTNLAPPRTEILAQFALFRSTLDDVNDRRERLVKISRDITIASKRAIFHLHRALTSVEDDDTIVGEEKREKLDEGAVEEGGKLLEGIDVLWEKVGKELEGQDFWRHAPTISPGLQEYIEALSFRHYLMHGRLVTYAETQDALCATDGSPSDYLLGLSDLTGELMRFAITAIGTHGGSDRAISVCTFVRNCKADFEVLTPYIQGLGKKQHTTSASLKKIEDAIYGVVVRSSEDVGDGGNSREAMQLVAQRYAAGRGFSQPAEEERSDQYWL